MNTSAALLFLAFAAGLGQASSPTVPAPARVAVSPIAEIRRLHPEDAVMARPIRLSGTVTFSDSEEPELYVQDATGGIAVQYSPSDPPVSVGDGVLIEGLTTYARGAVRVASHRLQRLGVTGLPRARRVSMDELLQGDADGQSVEIGGIVHDLHFEKNDTVIDLGVGTSHLRVQVHRTSPADAARLVDASVRVRGVAAMLVNPQGQPLDPELAVPDFTFVTVDTPSPADEFGGRVVPLAYAQTYAREAGGHRVRVEGVVTRYRPGIGLYIENASVGLYVETGQKALIRPGDRVEVIGFAAADRFAPLLEHALFRKVAEGPVPSPEVAAARDVLARTHEARLVRVRGRLLEVSEGPDEKILRLTSEGIMFRAVVDATSATPLPAQVVPGCELDLTGVVYLRELDLHRVPRSFDVLMRTLDDIVVATPAPRWLWARRVETYGVPLALGLAALLLAVAIRRRVRARGLRDARRQAERPLATRSTTPPASELSVRATLDGLRVAAVMLDLRGQVTFCNALLLGLLDRPRSFVVGCDWDTFLPPGDARDRWHQRFKEAVRAGIAPPDDVDEIVTRRGVRKRLAWHHAPVRDGKGRVIGLLSVGANIPPE